MNGIRIATVSLFVGIFLTISAEAAFRESKVLKREAVDSRLKGIMDCPDPDIRAISYQAYRMTGDTPEPGVNVPLITIEFPGLTQKQFLFLKEKYGNGLSDIKYQNGQTYRLEDFLPPVMQALLNRQFLPEYRGGEDGFRQLLYTNCYITAYAVTLTMAADGSGRNDLPVFTASHDRMKAVFEDETLFERLPRTTPSNISEPNAKFGDIILHKMRGGMRGFIDHVRIYIDKDLYFEKTGPSANDTYALVYFPSFIVTGSYDFDYIRPRKEAILPLPRNAFREAASVSGTESVFREGPLNIIDISLETDPSGRTRLPGGAYAPSWGME